MNNRKCVWLLVTHIYVFYTFFFEICVRHFISILQSEFVPHMEDNDDTMETNKNKDSENDIFASKPQGGLPEDYIERMSKPGVWGDGIVLQCASLLYKRRIQIVWSNGRTAEFKPEEEQVDDPSPLVLGFVKTPGSSEENHYIYLRPRGSITGPDAQIG